MQRPMFAPSLQHDRPQFTVGSVHWDEQGRLWRYGKANGAVTAGHTVIFARDDTWDGAPITTTLVDTKNWFLGVADRAFTDNYFGWFWVGYGFFEVVIANAVSALTVLTSTGTAGVLGTGGGIIDGMQNVDAGVTDTRVTCVAYGLLTVGVTAAYD